jgi:di/tricarboxylate transporter
MSQVAIVFTIIIAALALFIWNRIPAVIVGIAVSLALLFTGILSGNEAVAGFGDPVVVLIAGLFVVGAGLEAAGVTTWAGQLLVEKAGASRTRLMILVFLLVAIFTATISVNGTVAALLPVGVVVALRMKMPTSQLLLPLCFSSHSAVMLTLIGAPLNILGSNAAEEAGYGGIAFFAFAVAGIPMMLGSWAIMILTQRFLLPHRNGGSLPPDFSEHARTLVEQYRLEDGLQRLRVRSSSPFVGAPRGAVDLKDHPGLSLVGIEEGETGSPCNGPSSPRATCCWCAATRMPRAGSPPTSTWRSAPKWAPRPSPRRSSIAAQASPR